jgi:hypothetical protein
VQVIGLLEPTTGIEPVNLFLTKEALYLLSYVGNQEVHILCCHGAGNGARTRDPQLGRLML